MQLLTNARRRFQGGLKILSNRLTAHDMSDAPPREFSVSAPASVLAGRIVLHIQSLVPQGRARCLDVGRGDMKLAEAIEKRALHTDWRCIGVDPVPACVGAHARWGK